VIIDYSLAWASASASVSRRKQTVKRVIEFKQDDGVVLVEVDDDTKRADQLSGRDGATEKARQSFEEAAAGIGPIAAMILRQITSLAPESVTVEFGIKFNAQAGVMIASSSVESNCKIVLAWKPKSLSA
jgi:hypothetical protein